MYKKMLVIVFMSMLMFPVFAENTEVPLNNSQSQEEIVIPEQETLGIQDQEKQEVQETPSEGVIKEPIQYKQPVSKKKLAKKFVLAMLCVVGTSIFLYIVLSLYNKIRDSIYSRDVFSPNAAQLDTPSDITEAVKSFVEKTHWDN